MDFSAWRLRANSAKKNPVDLERITAAKSAAYVVGTADIVKHYHNTRIGKGPVLFGTDPIQFIVEQFSVPHYPIDMN